MLTACSLAWHRLFLPGRELSRCSQVREPWEQAPLMRTSVCPSVRSPEAPEHL